jgi:NADH dehydrogenase
MKTENLNSAAPLNLVILGGGYAGLMALITLKNRSPNAYITLIDPRPYHLVITRLHETVHRPLETIQISFAHLAKRFDFIHKQCAIEFDQTMLTKWDKEKCLQVGDETIPFDYLLIATGALSGPADNPPNIYDLNSLSKNCFALVLQKLITDTTSVQVVINIVGAGPTGIQFAFEISHVLLRCHKNFRLNLIDSHEKLLSAFPTEMSDYVEQRMSEKQISLLNNQYYKGAQGDQIVLENKQSGEKTWLASDLTLLLLGKKPQLTLHANCSGQVINDQTVLNHIFTAADCSYYDEMGSNLLTSQSALRKGRAAAKNILLQAGVLRFCLPYMHQDIGYLLSLGPSDAIGWIGSKNKLISGLPAFMAKEAIEAQYDWLLSGFDSYVI